MAEYKDLKDNPTQMQMRGPKLWKDMTPEEKGALLLARHEGKVIEWNGLHTATGKWVGWTDCGDGYLWDGTFSGNGFAYRVKPEPVVVTVVMTGGVFSGFARGDEEPDDTHRITFDLVDGKPDCNSVKMEEI